MSGKIGGRKRGYQTLTPEDTEEKLPNPIRVKNKNPAPIQITAEQILQEARQLHNAEFSPPKQKINDYDELVEYRRGKRKQFEDQISRAGSDKNIWIDYAEWEDSQKDLERARSVWERALDVADHRQNHSIWVKYAEFEMNNKCINHARNVWDRAVTLLPSANQLWIKYIHMERMLGNVAGAREIFKRRMVWMPDDEEAWLSYIEFELACDEVDRARAIFELFVQIHPKVESWIRYANFQKKNGRRIDRCRNVFERAVLHGLADDDEEAEQQKIKLCTDIQQFCLF